jgi:hypothetical protein
MIRPPTYEFAKVLAEARLVELRGGKPLRFARPCRRNPRDN